MFPPALLLRATALVERCRTGGVRLATAESCTGGLVAALLTEVAGSSVAFERGFVTYSNDAKTELLGVGADILANHGAVSAPCARAMAEGALAASRADRAVSVTGIAGPGGGSPDKPVGLVHFALARRDGPTLDVARRFAEGTRGAIRMAAVEQALALMEASLPV